MLDSRLRGNDGGGGDDGNAPNCDTALEPTACPTMSTATMTDLPAPTDLAAARAVVALLSARLQAAAITDLRAPPPEPTACCGRGCNGCVWEGYYAALAWWRDNALERLQAGPA
jgi:hypothetical protein